MFLILPSRSRISIHRVSKMHDRALKSNATSAEQRGIRKVRAIQISTKRTDKYSEISCKSSFCATWKSLG